MNWDTISSWRDPRYLATTIGILLLGAIFFYLGLVRPQLVDPVAVAVVVIALLLWLIQFIYKRS